MTRVGRRQWFIHQLRRNAGRAALLAAMATWWFVLRPDTAVVNAVDTVSYLVSVYSVWRGAGSLAARVKSEGFRVGRREVAEPGQQGCVGGVAEVGGEPAEGVGEGVLP